MERCWLHTLWEEQVSGLMATSCDFEPVVDKRHSAEFQGTLPLSACIARPQLEVHAAEKPHCVVNDECRESGQRYGLSVVGVEFAVFAIRPPACLPDVSFCLTVHLNGINRLHRLIYLESTGSC